MSHEDARDILDADYRPPAQRGDIGSLPAGSVVALIDGVFHQQRSISPRELMQATERGIHIIAGGSMGALRAAEVPRLEGVGQIFEMYKRGRIKRDDEVALVFCPETYRNLTVPLVNVRFAVERLVTSGTLDAAIGQRIVDAASRLHYTERTYESILAHAGLGDRSDAADLCAMLGRHDLKREDAQTALESLPEFAAKVAALPGEANAPAVEAPRFDFGADDGLSEVRVADSLAADAPMMLWELGETVTWKELLCFLRMTGRFDHHARRAVARYALSGNPVEIDDGSPPSADDAQRAFEDLRTTWGWDCEDEVHVTMTDLGVGLEDISVACHEEVAAVRTVAAIVADGSAEFQRALRCELLMNDIALKRELMRVGSLAALARRAAQDGSPATAAELQQARLVLCRKSEKRDWPSLARTVAVDPEARDAFVERLALARRQARQIVARRELAHTRVDRDRVGSTWQLKPCAKAAGDSRFSTRMEDALAVTRRLQQVIGITRVGMIGELGDMDVQIGQAARPGGLWSSTYGSGKSESAAGAEVGSVMEEAEKWAQELFDPSRSELTVASLEQLRADGRHAADPARLDLPFDSSYEPAKPLEWYEAYDLLGRRPILVPRDLIVYRRSANDLLFSRRGSRKVFSSNGLASGMKLEEAVLHGICECIERHARRLCDVRLNNPGGFGYDGYRIVDLTACGDRISRLLTKLERGDNQVRVLDITSAVRVPTYHAVIEDTQTRSQALGWAAHPDPEVALHMALLEAAQSAVISIAGGREDLMIQARSLGRHEGARPRRAESFWYWADPDRPTATLADAGGFRTADIYQEVLWVLDELERAGLSYVAVVDLTVEDMLPARAVRVLLPELETTNPFFTGLHARACTLPDLLPRG